MDCLAAIHMARGGFLGARLRLAPKDPLVKNDSVHKRHSFQPWNSQVPLDGVFSASHRKPTFASALALAFSPLRLSLSLSLFLTLHPISTCYNL